MAEATIQRIINSLLGLYLFTVGRRMFAMSEVERRAQQRGLTAVAEHAARCLEHDRGVYRLQGRYKPAAASLYGPNARQYDAAVDRILVSLDGYLGIQLQIFDEDHPRAKAALSLRQRFFPNGVNTVIRLPYPEEHMHVTLMLKEASEDAEVIEALAVLTELAVVFDDLRAANAAYGSAISEDDGRPSSDELRAARDQGQRLMSEVVALIIGHFALNAPDDAAGLNYLLEPVMNQQAALGAIYRRRRRATDIDPDTGAELPGDDAPAGELPPDDAPDESGDQPSDELPPGDQPGDQLPDDDGVPNTDVPADGDTDSEVAATSTRTVRPAKPAA